jgi:putative transposase
MPAVTRYQRSASFLECPARPTTGCATSRSPERRKDPVADAVEEQFRKRGGRYGTRRIKRALAKREITASRKRIGEAMKSCGLVSCHTKTKFKPHPDRPNEAELPNVLNREFDGHAASARKDAALVKAAFATVAFWLFEIDVFHTDRGSEFGNAAIDEMLEVFGVTRSLSKWVYGRVI